jgi:hypothetical protein
MTHYRPPPHARSVIHEEAKLLSDEERIDMPPRSTTRKTTTDEPSFSDGGTTSR